MGGWLSVRGLLRYSLTSAGIVDNADDWHLGHTIFYAPQNQMNWSDQPTRDTRGESQM
jgi:hypothetical protein